jgi:hypothetical protein
MGPEEDEQGFYDPMGDLNGSDSGYPEQTYDNAATEYSFIDAAPSASDSGYLEQSFGASEYDNAAASEYAMNDAGPSASDSRYLDQGVGACARVYPCRGNQQEVLKRDPECVTRAQLKYVSCRNEAKEIEPGDYRDYRVEKCKKELATNLKACPIRSVCE